MFTMRPGFSAAIRRRATSHDSTYTARTFVSSTASISSSDILWARCASGMPALFTRIVTVPNAASAASTAPAMAVASLTSSGTLTAVPPDGGDLGHEVVELLDPTRRRPPPTHRRPRASARTAAPARTTPR